MLQHDRAHQDKDFELSYVKFRSEIKKIRAIIYQLHRNIDHAETSIVPIYIYLSVYIFTIMAKNLYILSVYIFTIKAKINI